MDKKNAKQAYITAARCFADHVSISATDYIRRLMGEKVKQMDLIEDETEINEIVEAVIFDLQSQLSLYVKDLRQSASERAQAYVDKTYRV